jgi:hypothetical protein
VEKTPQAVLAGGWEKEKESSAELAEAARLSNELSSHD